MMSKKHNTPLTKRGRQNEQMFSSKEDVKPSLREIHYSEALGRTIDYTGWDDYTALCIDLDETLISTQNGIQTLLKLGLLDKAEYSHLRRRIMLLDFYNNEGSFSDEQMWSIIRPHTDEFIELVNEMYDYVIVWSAGLQHYVNRVTQCTFTDAGHPEPYAVFARHECYDNNGDAIKPLDLLYEKLPEFIGKVKPHNIHLLDDKESTFVMNVDRGLMIDKYEPELSIEGIEADDRQLLTAIECLKRRLKNK